MKIDPISNHGYTSAITPRPPVSAARATQHPPAEGAASSSVQGGLTTSERAMFASLFPASSAQINAHRTYSANGVHSPVEPGQIINRKV